MYKCLIKTQGNAERARRCSAARFQLSEIFAPRIRFIEKFRGSWVKFRRSETHLQRDPAALSSRVRKDHWSRFVEGALWIPRYPPKLGISFRKFSNVAPYR